jgi:hypothetical protein
VVVRENDQGLLGQHVVTREALDAADDVVLALQARVVGDLPGVLVGNICTPATGVA